jgi:hypothetical protein
LHEIQAYRQQSSSCYDCPPQDLSAQNLPFHRSTFRMSNVVQAIVAATVSLIDWKRLWDFAARLAQAPFFRHFSGMASGATIGRGHPACRWDTGVERNCLAGVANRSVIDEYIGLLRVDVNFQNSIPGLALGQGSGCSDKQDRYCEKKRLPEQPRPRHLNSPSGPLFTSLCWLLPIQKLHFKGQSSKCRRF